MMQFFLILLTLSFIEITLSENITSAPVAAFLASLYIENFIFVIFYIT